MPHQGKKEKKESKQKKKAEAEAKSKKKKRAASNEGSDEAIETEVSSIASSDAESNKKGKKKKSKHKSKEKDKEKEKEKEKKSKKKRRVQHSSDGEDSDPEEAARAAAAKIAASGRVPAAGYPGHPPGHPSHMPMIPPHWPPMPGMPPMHMPPHGGIHNPHRSLGDRSRSRDGAPSLKTKASDTGEESQASQPTLKLKVAAPEKVDIMQVPRAMIGRIVGNGGAAIKEIRAKTGARIDARDQTEDDPVEVLVSGSTEAVELAKTMLLNVAEGAEVQGSVSAGGSSASTAPPVAVTPAQPVRQSRWGSPGASAAAAAAAAIAAAVSAAKGVGATAPSTAPASSDDASLDNKAAADAAGSTAAAVVPQPAPAVPMIEDALDLPKQATGKIIGTKGQQIADIRQQSGAQVDIDKAAPGCRVRIVGTQEQVEKAKKMLLSITEPAAVEGPCEYMEIPKTSVGRVIGAGGSRIAEMQERSGAKIDIDRSTDRVMVRFSGEQVQIDTAKNLLLEVLEGRSTAVGEAGAVMEVPPSATGRLIGPGGRQINEIQEKSGAKVDIDKSRDPCIVRFSGTKEAIEKAQEMVKDVVAMAAQRASGLSSRRSTRAGGEEETISFEVPQEIVSSMVGDGQWIRSAMQKSGARIIVRYAEGKTLLEMSGNPGQVVEAEGLAEEAARNFKNGMPSSASILAVTLPKSAALAPLSTDLSGGLPTFAKSSSAPLVPKLPPRPPQASLGTGPTQSEWQLKAPPAVPFQPLAGASNFQSPPQAETFVPQSQPPAAAAGPTNQGAAAAVSQPQPMAAPVPAAGALCGCSPTIGCNGAAACTSAVTSEAAAPGGCQAPATVSAPPSNPSGPPPNGPPPSGPPPSGPPPTGPQPGGPPVAVSGPPAMAAAAAPATQIIQGIPMAQPQLQPCFAPTIAFLPPPGACLLPGLAQPQLGFAPQLLGGIPGMLPGMMAPMPNLG